MGLVLGYVVRIQHDDWSIRLGENGPDRVLKYMAVMLISCISHFRFLRRVTLQLCSWFSGALHLQTYNDIEELLLSKYQEKYVNISNNSIAHAIEN